MPPAMEAHANGIDDVLADSLSIKIKNSAKYVVDRHSVSFHTSGSNADRTTSGANVLKVVLTGISWLVPDNVRLAFNLKNNGGGNKRLRTLSGPHSCPRMRVLCGGQVVEDFDYARTNEMFSLLHASETPRR